MFALFLFVYFFIIISFIIVYVYLFISFLLFTFFICIFFYLTWPDVLVKIKSKAYQLNAGGGNKVNKSSAGKVHKYK